MCTIKNFPYIILDFCILYHVKIINLGDSNKFKEYLFNKFFLNLFSLF